MRDPEFFRDMGRIGGRAGKGSPAKKESARRAIQIRWQKYPGVRVKLTLERSVLWISQRVPGLEKALTTTIRRRKSGGGLVAEPYSALFREGNRLWTHSPFLHRVKGFLKTSKIPFTVSMVRPPLYLRQETNFSAALAGHATRRQRAITRLFKLPVGGLCRASGRLRVEIIADIFKAYPRTLGVIVVEELAVAASMALDLRELLGGEQIGFLTGERADWERITIMTPAYINTGVIRPNDCGILIFERCPRKGFMRVQDAIFKAFPLAWRLAFLGSEKRDHYLRFLAESAFGPLIEIGGI